MSRFALIFFAVSSAMSLAAQGETEFHRYVQAAIGEVQKLKEETNTYKTPDREELARHVESIEFYLDSAATALGGEAVRVQKPEAAGTVRKDLDRARTQLTKLREELGARVPRESRMDRLADGIEAAMRDASWTLHAVEPKKAE